MQQKIILILSFCFVTLKGAAYNDEDYKIFCVMQQIANLFFSLKASENEEINQTYLEHNLKYAPIFFSQDTRKEDINPTNNCNIIQGLLYAPYQDTFFCRLGSWTFTRKKKYTHFVGKDPNIHDSKNIFLTNDDIHQWAPLYNELLKKGRITGATFCQKKPYVLINITQVGDIDIETLVTKNIIAAFQENSPEHHYALSIIKKKSLAPEEPVALWREMKQNYENEKKLKDASK